MYSFSSTFYISSVLFSNIFLTFSVLFDLLAGIEKSSYFEYCSTTYMVIVNKKALTQPNGIPASDE